MIIVYGDSKGCLVCGILKFLLKDSVLTHRFYEMDIDYSIEDVRELYPNFDTVPFILKDGGEIGLPELERMIDDANSTRRTKI